MNKFIFRVLLAIIIFPLLYLFIFVITGFHFVALVLFILAFVVVGAFEVRNFFDKAHIPTFKYSAPILSVTIPLVTYFEVFFLTGYDALTYKWLIIVLAAMFIRTIFTVRKKNMNSIIPLAISSSFILIYPGLFMTYMIRLLAFRNSSCVFLFFLSLVFSNEIISYLCGKFFGQSTKLNLAISPNKTLVGFISGFVGSIATAVVFYFLVPDLFSADLFNVMLFGSLIGLTTIFGDLFESAMKRSANLKDSGFIMMGRGGILDTVDSFLLSAPVFYLIYPLIS
ncbi:MAG: phosphatidate cytidylyltransferase [Spirochaetales bacterium]|nr:phosphatidate cytidylyltransferase [Spirochaetales bacterium]